MDGDGDTFMDSDECQRQLRSHESVWREWTPSPTLSPHRSPRPVRTETPVPTHPLDEDVGICSISTPTIGEFYDRATAAITARHVVRTSTATSPESPERTLGAAGGRTASGGWHTIVSAVAAGPLFHPYTSLVVLGTDADAAFDYVGHYLVDAPADAKHVRVVSAWSQTAWARLGEIDHARFAPLARVVFEVFGRPLHLWSALNHTPQAPRATLVDRATVAPMLRLGCYTRSFALEDAVAESRRRRGAAVRIQRAWRRSRRRGWGAKNDLADRIVVGMKRMRVD
jgi:hypothetical protein